MGGPPRGTLLGMRPATSKRAQLLRFCVVGASGYAVNVLAFGVALALSIEQLVAAAIGFLIAMASNFWCNRSWTFAADHRGLALQAARFFTVSLVGLGVNLVILELLVSAAGMAELPSQAIAVALATPVNFIGNKLWTFDR